MMTRAIPLSALVLGLVAAAACGGTPADAADTELPVRANTKEGSGDTSGTPAAPSAVDATCATATVKAEGLPLHMVVVLDKSGSMCEYTSNTDPRDCGNPSSKWQQVRKGLEAFFASPQSKGITVSLIAFPVSSNTCSASSYQTPIRADVALPDTGGALTAEIAKLNADGTTPTRPALEGAVNYARTVEKKLAGKGRVAVVMATDGYPQGCDNNAISNASSVAAAAKGTIPTYVIGVGNLLNDLNALALAGGTRKAFIVSTTNAAVIGQELVTALTQIRGASLACEYSLPTAPPGQNLDLAKMNVQYTNGAALVQTLPLSADCAAADGWRYDNAAAPTKILLCPTACGRAKTDANAKIDLILGCTSQAGSSGSSGGSGGPK